MNQVNPVYHSKRINASAVCPYCDGVQEHEVWCATQDPVVFYAYQIVSDASRLTLEDSLILHSLGAAWVETRG
ncbi:MAG TPA: hypothetical protein VMR80_15195 [Candidatus Acidoferrum sp.]|nr:hypothetical protein [Candidatus Acidoferrum sp.]